MGVIWGQLSLGEEQLPQREGTLVLTDSKVKRAKGKVKPARSPMGKGCICRLPREEGQGEEDAEGV